MQDFWVSAFFVEVAIKGNLTHQETTKLTEEISTVVFHTNKGTFNKKHTPPLVLKPGDSLVFERTQFHSDLSRCFVFLQTGSGPELNVICDFGVWECGKDEAAGLVVTNEFTTSPPDSVTNYMSSFLDDDWMKKRGYVV